MGVRSSHLLQSIGVPLAVLAVWEGACRLFEISALVLPTPSSILIRLYALTSSGMIWPHFWATKKMAFFDHFSCDPDHSSSPSLSFAKFWDCLCLLGNIQALT